MKELGEQVKIYEKGTDGPVIFWMMYPFQEGETEHLVECIEDLMPDAPYALAVIQVNDWNSDLSPWEAEAVMGEEAFAGKGQETLNRLLETCVPLVMNELGTSRKMFLMGYSLAGLFAMWTAYKTDVFSGYASCSGSLWFDGWGDFAEKNRICSECDIYLSLGGKEEKTSNPVMATIGEAYRRQEKILKADPNARRLIFEMNSGGHFADSGKRLAKAVKWLLEVR